MLNEIDANQELLGRLSENKLKNTDDLMAFIQNASRLAALGDNTEAERLNEIFARPEFAGNLPETLKIRCEQGIWEVEEYFGKELAFSLIDAQDFYCFSRRFPDILQRKVKIPLGCMAELRHWFEVWFDACESAELDEDAAEILCDFLTVYPIPEEERLPIVNTPITENEYKLLAYLIKPPKFVTIIINGEQPDQISSGFVGNLALAAAGGENGQNNHIKIEMRYGNFEFTALIYHSRQHPSQSLLKIEGMSDKLQGCKIQLTLNNKPFESMGTFEQDGGRYVCLGYIDWNFLTLAGDPENINVSSIRVYHE
jgi:hypothetical protein